MAVHSTATGGGEGGRKVVSGIVTGGVRRRIATVVSTVYNQSLRTDIVGQNGRSMEVLPFRGNEIRVRDDSTLVDYAHRPMK